MDLNRLTMLLVLIHPNQMSSHRTRCLQVRIQIRPWRRPPPCLPSKQGSSLQQDLDYPVASDSVCLLRLRIEMQPHDSEKAPSSNMTTDGSRAVGSTVETWKRRLQEILDSSKDQSQQLQPSDATNAVVEFTSEDDLFNSQAVGVAN